MTQSPDAQKLAHTISEERLWSRLMAMAQHGAIPGGGVNRQALSAEDARGQAELAGWARARGFACFRDDIGNLFVRREGDDPRADPVMIGSHLDSQPSGGKFDGAYGVLAGFEVLEALADIDLRTKRPIEVVAWMNEEGSRFAPGAMGSGVFGGSYDLEQTKARTDSAGVSVASGLAEVDRLTRLPRRTLREVSPHSYLEAHIEQGPLLEAQQATIGIVTGIQGICRFSVELLGRESHAGTTPRRLRKDAMSAAVLAISRLEELMADPDDILRFTVGSLFVAPNSPNTVPSRVRFSIDLRHPSNAILEALSERIGSVVAAAGRQRDCQSKVERITFVRSTVFDPNIIDLTRRTTIDLGYRSLDLPSGAGHDAMHLAKLCPSGMIFIPCAGGVSHNVAESATAMDVVAGARVLGVATLELAES